MAGRRRLNAYHVIALLVSLTTYMPVQQ